FNIYGNGIGSLTSRVIRSFNFVEIRYCKLSEAGVGVGMIGSACVINDVFIKNTVRGINGGFVSDTSNYNISNCIILLSDENSYGITVSLGGTYHITNNIILFKGTNGLTQGISVGAPRSVYIYNNLISGFSYRSIYFDIVIDTAFVKNNVLINSGAAISSSGNKIYTNNLVLSNNYFGIDQIGGGFIDSDYNLFWNNVFDFFNASSYGDSDRVADPMFVKDTLPNPQLDFDYHLQAFSPGIDAGNPEI